MRRILANPRVYNLFLNVMGSDTFRKSFVRDYIKPADVDILDIGCGTGDILNYLSETCNYTGFDASSRYIEMARTYFKGRGKFCCGLVGQNCVEKGVEFDVALALGVLHHLDDDQSSQLFESSYQMLKPGGRLITLDGCFTDSQSWISRLLLKMDRGNFVRNEAEYTSMAEFWFPKVVATVFNKKGAVPYSYIIMECFRE